MQIREISSPPSSSSVWTTFLRWGQRGHHHVCMILHSTDCYMMRMMMLLLMITIYMMVKAAEHSSVQCSVRRLHWGQWPHFHLALLFIIITISIILSIILGG